MKCDQKVEYGTIKSSIVRISPLYMQIKDCTDKKWEKWIKWYHHFSGTGFLLKVFCECIFDFLYFVLDLSRHNFCTVLLIPISLIFLQRYYYFKLCQEEVWWRIYLAKKAQEKPNSWLLMTVEIVKTMSCENLTVIFQKLHICLLRFCQK